MKKFAASVNMLFCWCAGWFVVFLLGHNSLVREPYGCQKIGMTSVDH